MESKTHYKMYKDGKKWAFASLTTAGLSLAILGANATAANADQKVADKPNDETSAKTTTIKVAQKQVVLKSKQSVAVKSNTTDTENEDAKTNTSSAADAVKKAATKLDQASSSAAVKSDDQSAVREATEIKKQVTSAQVKASVTEVDDASKTVVKKVATSAKKAADSTSKKNPTSAKYHIDRSHALGANEGSNQKAKKNVIVAHAVGQYSSAKNVAIYEKREWKNSQTYVHYIVGDGGKVYAVGEEGYVAWGAGSWANANSPVQVELAQTYSAAQFKKDYATYVNLLRDSAKKYGIPTTLDSSSNRGIKSHLWITNNVWGDHVDPYGYLSSHGISKAQFAHDLQYGIGGNSNTGGNTNNGSHSNNNNNNGSNKNNGKIKVGSQVTINKNAKRWATGQNIYNGVKGHTYKVIQIKGSNLLLDKVMSWISTSNVTLKGGSSSNNGSGNTNKGGSNNKGGSTSKGGTIKVGSTVTINKNAKRWATGQSIYNGVKGKSYKVIQINGSRLLLDKVMSWINKPDVTLKGGSTNNSNKGNNSSHSNSGNSKTIKVGTKVTINKNAKKWATGQSIYNGVKGKTYKVIQINGNRLLLDKVISWISKSNVTVAGSSSNSNSSNKNNGGSNSHKSNTINVGSKVTIHKNAKRWATGQSIYNGVKGKTYKVIQINGQRLLLDKVMSWINKADVSLAGSSNSNNSSKNNNGGNVHLSNSRWSAAQTKFVNSIVNDVIRVAKANGLYASVAMAQAVLESGYGSSKLATAAHNLFGIKADSSWKGASYSIKTREVINGKSVYVTQKFRKYASFADSIADYAAKLKSRPQYANAFKNHAKNYVQSIKAIKAGGYATDPNYVAGVVNCVNLNDFYKLDGLAKPIWL